LTVLCQQATDVAAIQPGDLRGLTLIAASAGEQGVQIHGREALEHFFFLFGVGPAQINELSEARFERVGGRARTCVSDEAKRRVRLDHVLELADVAREVARLE
jgi:hypothetical protein